MAKRYTSRGESKDKEFEASLRSCDPHERFSLNANHTIEKKKKWMMNGKKFCLNCWLLFDFCTCGFEKECGIVINHHIWIYFHYREYGRSTNTGMLINRVLTNNSSVVYYGNKEQESAMINSITDSIENSIVLFPAVGSSITFEEYLKKKSFNNHNNNNAVPEQKEIETTCSIPTQPLLTLPSPTPLPTPPSASPTLPSPTPKPPTSTPTYNIIILDATWRQAKAMLKRLPTNLSRIKLGSNQRTISKLRKQSAPDRVTSAEATIYLLEEMGENTKEVQKLMDILENRLDHVDRQSGGISKVKANVNEWSEDEDEEGDEEEEEEGLDRKLNRKNKVKGKVKGGDVKKSEKVEVGTVSDAYSKGEDKRARRLAKRQATREERTTRRASKNVLNEAHLGTTGNPTPTATTTATASDPTTSDSRDEKKRKASSMVDEVNKEEEKEEHSQSVPSSLSADPPGDTSKKLKTE